MALRLDKAVVRGEVDNTRPGKVTGRLWLIGRKEPVVLALQGNAWRDVAGRKITFRNPNPEAQSSAESLRSEQNGVVGDITASNKVKVFTVPEEEWLAAYEERRTEEVPTEWRNALYLEWFSEMNGRVVIESADFEIGISEGVWEMDEAAEEAQRRSNMEAMRTWLATIIQRRELESDEFDTDFDDDEDAWEASLKESDRIGDAHAEALEKFGHEAIGDDRVAYVMGWDHMLGMDENSMSEAGVDEDDDVADPGETFIEDDVEVPREGEAWNRHPLQRRSRDLVVRILNDVEDLPREEFGGEEKDTPLDLFIRNTMNISGKLAGALGRLNTDQARDTQMNGYTLAILRRCLNWANEAISALNAVSELPAWKNRADALEHYRAELFAIRAAITELRGELRGRK
jgi:hypothetical protein